MLFVFAGSSDFKESSFIIPLKTEQHLHLVNATLCYSIAGIPNGYFNLVSDKCISVNAYYISALKVDHLNVIGKIGITAVDKNGNCQNIEIDLKSCTATVGAMSVTTGSAYSVAGITVSVQNHGYLIVVPNCQPASVVMLVSCKTTPVADMLQFNIAQGSTVMTTSHGLVGKTRIAEISSINDS